MRPGRLWPVLRDVGAWAIGCVIIFKQAGILFDPPSQVNETLVWVGALWVGGPGILAVLAARFPSTPGGGSPQAPAPPDSSPSSPGASSRGAE